MLRESVRLVFVPLRLSGIAKAEASLETPTSTVPPAAIGDNRGSAEGIGNRLQIQVDRSRVDSEAHKLGVRLNRPASRIEVKIYGDDIGLVREEWPLDTDRFRGIQRVGAARRAPGCGGRTAKSSCRLRPVG